MMEHDNVRKRMYICVCDWVTLLYSTKLIEPCKPAIMEKIKIIINKKKEPLYDPATNSWAYIWTKLQFKKIHAPVCA